MPTNPLECRSLNENAHPIAMPYQQVDTGGKVEKRKNPAKPLFLAGFAGLKDGGAEGSRTPDPHNAIVVLYQLSYDPTQKREKSSSPGQIVKTFSRAFSGLGATRLCRTPVVCALWERGHSCPLLCSGHTEAPKRTGMSALR